MPAIELGIRPPRRIDFRTQEERDDDRIEAINRRIAELMKFEWNPEHDDCITDALDNLTEEQKEIRAALIKHNSPNTTAIFRTWVRQWCELRAEKQALEEIER